jgi:D-lactate dehydrogenase (cytochrome)
MFRNPAARVRQLALPFLKRGVPRAQTTAAELSGKPNGLSKPFWTSGRVLLFTALTGSFAYTYGINEGSPRLQLPWLGSLKPRYASKGDMEKVQFQTCGPSVPGGKI